MKLFELRPFAARLTTSTPAVASRRRPGPQPASSATVESPTSTTRIEGGCGEKRRVSDPNSQLPTPKRRSLLSTAPLLPGSRGHDVLAGRPPTPLHLTSQ